MSWKVPEIYRAQSKGFETVKGDPFGFFVVPSCDKSRVTKAMLYIIAGDGIDGDIDWEHVSLRAVKRFGKQFKNMTPTWEEMCQVKSLFWDANDVVIQLHPAEKNYVNQHPNVLHLWRPTKETIPVPPLIAV